MIWSKTLKTQNARGGFSRLLQDLKPGKNMIALMTPHFSNQEMLESLKDLEKYSVIGGVVDGIQGYSGPCISLSVLDDGSPFVIPDGIFLSRDKSVGRWASSLQNSRMRSGGFDGAQQIIKPFLQDLTKSWLPNIKNQDQSFLFFSEKSSLHEFCQLLDSVYPNSSKIGIQTSPMLFKSGNLSCLFANSKIQTGGVVGFVLPLKRKISMGFMDLVSFSPILSISECRGNVIKKWKGPKVSFDDLKGSLYLQVLGFELDSIFQVIGGDPNSQNIVLESEIELKTGMEFRFMVKDTNAKLLKPKVSELSFSVNQLLDEDGNLEISSQETDGVLSVLSKDGSIVGGSSGPCVISPINNSVVGF